MTKRDEYFTPAEAAAKVGKRIRTKIAFSGIPIRTTGTVLNPDDRLVSLPILMGLTPAQKAVGGLVQQERV
ncbi:MAG: hypothetical protein H8E35_00040 [Ardenticatenia bacterium]|nr:hypothetical protein [Ardenticatenia bacterium]